MTTERFNFTSLSNWRLCPWGMCNWKDIEFSRKAQRQHSVCWPRGSRACRFKTRGVIRRWKRLNYARSSLTQVSVDSKLTGSIFVLQPRRDGSLIAMGHPRVTILNYERLINYYAKKWIVSPITLSSQIFDKLTQELVSGCLKILRWRPFNFGSATLETNPIVSISVLHVELPPLTMSGSLAGHDDFSIGEWGRNAT